MGVYRAARYSSVFQGTEEALCGSLYLIQNVETFRRFTPFRYQKAPGRYVRPGAFLFPLLLSYACGFESSLLLPPPMLPTRRAFLYPS